MKVKEDLAGTGRVFRFTLLQLLKSRANRILLALTLVLSLALLPVMTLIQGGDTAQPQETVRLLLLDNRTALPTEETEAWLRQRPGCENLTVAAGTAADAPGSVCFRLELTGGHFVLRLTGRAGDVSAAEAAGIGFLLRDYAAEAQYRAAGLTEAQIAGLTGGTAVRYDSWEEYLQSDTEPDIRYSESRYTTQFGYSVLLMMICVYAVSFIIRSVVEEKASKLVDLLLVSVKPMALLLGKVLAALAFVLLCAAVLLAGTLLSYHVTGLFLDVSGTVTLVQSLLDIRLSPSGLLVVLVSSVLGYLSFGILAGLSGAGCSNTEESSGAMSACMLLIMTGYMVSVVIGSLEGQSLLKLNVLSVLPVLSMFMVPLRFMNGDLGPALVGLSWLLELLFLLFVLRIAAKVYSYLIIYNGKRLTLSEIFRLARGKEAGI